LWKFVIIPSHVTMYKVVIPVGKPKPPL
jgi:hypothetical protein